MARRERIHSSAPTPQSKSLHDTDCSFNNQQRRSFGQAIPTLHQILKSKMMVFADIWYWTRPTCDVILTSEFPILFFHSRLNRKSELFPRPQRNKGPYTADRSQARTL